MGTGKETGCGDGTPGGVADFQSRLRRLKRDGCNLLVVGDAPREVFTRASASMLGDPSVRRWRVFALTDATAESVRERLPADSDAPRPLSETTRVVDHAVSARSATADAEPPTDGIPTVSVGGGGGIDELETRLVEVIEEFGERSHRPAELRVSVDSLLPLLEDHEFGTVYRFLRTVGARVRANDAMAHYVLPEPHDGDRCRRLAGAFDAVIELRTAPEDADHDAEERWHLSEADAPTPWIPA